MIDANQYRASTQAVTEAIRESKSRGYPVRVVARGDVFTAVSRELYSECESLDHNRERMQFSGRDVDGVPWVVELSGGDA